MEQRTDIATAAPVAPSEGSTGKVADWVISGHLDRSGGRSDWSVQPTPFKVGRHPGLELFLPYATVSLLHAELTVDVDGLWVADCGSTNGTYVNGQRIEQRTRVGNGDYIQFADHVFRVSQADTVVDCETACGQMEDSALAIAQVERLIQNRAVTPHYQPIIEIATGHTMGYECLSRSSLYGLSNPKLMFEAASRLNLCSTLSSVCRSVGLEHAVRMDPDALIFVNTHPAELSELQRFDEHLAEIRSSLPDRKVVIEVHESTIADEHLVREIRAIADHNGMLIAYDDFGVGQTRILELSESPPDYLKFDISLIRGIDAANGRRQHLVANLIRTVHELGIASLAEGMETKDEAETCRQLGFRYAQGFFYGRPQPAHYWY